MPQTRPAVPVLPPLALLPLAAVMACASGSRAAPSPTAAAATATSSTATSAAAAPAGALMAPRDPAEDRLVDSLVARMTLEEKLGQLNQLSGAGDPTGPVNSPSSPAARAAQLQRGEIGSFFNVIGADTVRALQRMAVERTRLHVPLLFGLDVIHGFRTEFPVPLGEAASWDPATAERTARVAAVEASAAGINWTFAPMVDIARDARWGRIVEGAGEDPYLGSAFAIARTRGFQGRDLRAPDAIAATAKHFAAYGFAEAGRDYNVVHMGDRELRDVVLPPFHAAACTGVVTFMASFNEINGVPSHANPHLTTEILRREWGWDGMVVSDWTGVGELLNHGIGADSATVGTKALTAGVDMDMVSEIYQRHLGPAVRAGRIPMAVLDEAVRRVLRVKYRLGLFTDPYHGANAERARVVTLTAADRQLAREAARRSIVLLRNEGNVLPLRRNVRTIAVVGSLAADTGAVLGNWGAQGRAQDAVSVLDGIRRAVSPGTTVRYARGASPTSDDTSGVAEAVRAARGADAVVMVIGEVPDQSAEASSRATVDLPGGQQALARAIRATGVPVVAVLMNGRPLALQWLGDNVPAILETWFLGVEHGNAVADALFGDANPGGKLPVTFPRVTGQEPIYYAHVQTGRPSSLTEKYTSRYIDVPFTPLYPFGYGLSYTTFTVGAPRPSAGTLDATGSVGVDVDVANTGRVAGDEVVQLYLRQPVASVTRPVAQLVGFRRVTLAPGQRTTVHFTVNGADFAFHDQQMRRVVEPGAVLLMAGDRSDRLQSVPLTLTTAGNAPAVVPDACPSNAARDAGSGS